MNYPLARVLIAAGCATLPHAASAQSVDALGTRAAGMGGAFVAVVDDASAIYWNPGALASGSYFSLSVDRTEASTATSVPAPGSRSGFLVALAAPVVGLSYYRLRSTALTPSDPATDAGQLGRNVITPGNVRIERLVTHHIGATLVQSVTDAVAVGVTLKVVRGSVASGIVRDGNRDVLLADGLDVRDEEHTKFDGDIGVLATSGSLRAGLTIRNVSAPRFEVGDGEGVSLERQARAGAALTLAAGWTVAADFDLLKTSGPRGQMRDIAVGTEGRVAKRAVVRGGLNFNGLSQPQGRTPTVSIGGSYAVRASFLVDAQVTGGSEGSMRGWGIAGRFVY